MDMNTEYINIKDINETHLDIYVQPYADWHLEEHGFEVHPNLNLTWEVIEFNNTRMLIKVRFLNPVQISPKADRDTLMVHIYENSTLFFTSGDSFQLHPDCHSLKKEIPKQLSQEYLSLSDNAELLAKVVNSVLVMSAALAPVSTGPIFTMVMMINTLQIVMHMPMLNVAVPANMFTLQQFLVKSVTFDIFPDKLKEKVRHIIRFGKKPLR